MLVSARANPPIPAPDAAASLRAAQAFQRGGVLTALEALHTALGDVFQLPLPGFRGVMLVGPEANKLLLLQERERLLWRAETDPVTRVLRQGVLVTDGALHDELRQAITPSLHRSLFDGFARATQNNIDRVTDGWHDGARIHLLEASRRIALLILMEALYGEDFAPVMRELWDDIERTIRYISPGPWLIWPGVPRPGYSGALRRMDRYFRELIARRRKQPGDATDLPSLLIAAGMSDDLIRDQLFTMFIAGHDTSAALLAWTLALLTSHPEHLARAHAEVDAALGQESPTYAHARQLPYLDRVIKESLRLYPPIHLGSRIAATDISFREFRIRAGTRVLYSTYLTHRDPRYWPSSDVFEPDRFLPENTQGRPAYSYVPFGGGPRNCIGAAFAQLEARIALARLLQGFTFQPVGVVLRPRMRATLEPHPDTRIQVYRRQRNSLPGA